MDKTYKKYIELQMEYASRDLDDRIRGDLKQFYIDNEADIKNTFDYRAFAVREAMEETAEALKKEMREYCLADNKNDKHGSMSMFIHVRANGRMVGSKKKRRITGKKK